MNTNTNTLACLSTVIDRFAHRAHRAGCTQSSREHSGRGQSKYSGQVTTRTTILAAAHVHDDQMDEED